MKVYPWFVIFYDLSVVPLLFFGGAARSLRRCCNCGWCNFFSTWQFFFAWPSSGMRRVTKLMAGFGRNSRAASRLPIHLPFLFFIFSFLPFLF